MSDLELAYRSAAEIGALYRRKEVSPVELVRNALARIDEVNSALNCFCFTYPEEALHQARMAEDALFAGRPLGPLHGVPIAIKDFTPTRGKRTTLGSRVYEDWVPEEDAVVAERLREAGAILVGKTTTPEFAYASFTESPLWGVTRNPWNPERTPGGSSGGSAVAVATGCVSLAEGSDAGGSIRLPAACCGIVGFKPSVGRIPFDSLRSQFLTIWHHGPLARTVEDAALFVNVTQGPDDRDITSLPPLPPLPLPLPHDIRGLKIALSLDLGYYAIDPEVIAQTLAVAEALRDRGAVVEEVDIGWDRRINDACYLHFSVMMAMLFGQHLEQWRDKMDPFVVKLIEAAGSIDALALKNVELVRTAQWERMRPLFRTYDALLCPTLSMAAPEIGRNEFEFDYDDAQGRCRALDLTLQFNFIGQCPVVSVPSGLTGDGLPTAVQIVGRRYDDLTALRIAAALEEARPWPKPPTRWERAAPAC
jgi:Asp-tRNA(Asn)/Glu-tRNA(Gln) amidotransferase A subunit family amidase